MKEIRYIVAAEIGDRHQTKWSAWERTDDEVRSRVNMESDCDVVGQTLSKLGIRAVLQVRDVEVRETKSTQRSRA